MLEGIDNDKEGTAEKGANLTNLLPVVTVTPKEATSDITYPNTAEAPHKREGPRPKIYGLRYNTQLKGNPKWTGFLEAHANCISG